MSTKYIRESVHAMRRSAAIKTRCNLLGTTAQGIDGVGWVGPLVNRYDLDVQMLKAWAVRRTFDIKERIYGTI